MSLLQLGKPTWKSPAFLFERCYEADKIHLRFQDVIVCKEEPKCMLGQVND